VCSRSTPRATVVLADSFAYADRSPTTDAELVGTPVAVNPNAVSQVPASAAARRSGGDGPGNGGCDARRARRV